MLSISLIKHIINEKWDINQYIPLVKKYLIAQYFIMNPMVCHPVNHFL